MSTLMETETEIPTDALDYVRDLVTILARYHRDLGLSAADAYRVALREFAADYPEEILRLEAEATDDS